LVFGQFEIFSRKKTLKIMGKGPIFGQFGAKKRPFERGIADCAIPR